MTLGMRRLIFFCVFLWTVACTSGRSHASYRAKTIRGRSKTLTLGRRQLKTGKKEDKKGDKKEGKTGGKTTGKTGGKTTDKTKDSSVDASEASAFEAYEYHDNDLIAHDEHGDDGYGDDGVVGPGYADWDDGYGDDGYEDDGYGDDGYEEDDGYSDQKFKGYKGDTGDKGKTTKKKEGKHMKHNWMHKKKGAKAGHGFTDDDEADGFTGDHGTTAPTHETEYYGKKGKKANKNKHGQKGEVDYDVKYKSKGNTSFKYKGTKMVEKGGYKMKKSRSERSMRSKYKIVETQRPSEENRHPPTVAPTEPSGPIVRSLDITMSFGFFVELSGPPGDEEYERLKAETEAYAFDRFSEFFNEEARRKLSSHTTIFDSVMPVIENTYYTEGAALPVRVDMSLIVIFNEASTFVPDSMDLLDFFISDGEALTSFIVDYLWNEVDVWFEVQVITIESRLEGPPTLPPNVDPGDDDEALDDDEEEPPTLDDDEEEPPPIDDDMVEPPTVVEQLLLESPIAYGFFENSIASDLSDSDIAELEEATDSFFFDFLESYYSDTYGISFTALTTEVVTISFDESLERPLTVDFKFQIQFSVAETPSPTTEEMIIIMEEADFLEYITDYLWNSGDVWFETAQVYFGFGAAPPGGTYGPSVTSYPTLQTIIPAPTTAAPVASPESAFPSVSAEVIIGYDFFPGFAEEPADSDFDNLLEFTTDFFTDVFTTEYTDDEAYSFTSVSGEIVNSMYADGLPTPLEVQFLYHIYFEGFLPKDEEIVSIFERSSKSDYVYNYLWDDDGLLRDVQEADIEARPSI